MHEKSVHSGMIHSNDNHHHQAWTYSHTSRCCERPSLHPCL